MEWDDHISVSASHSPVDTAQDLMWLGYCSGTLLSPVQLASTSSPRGLSARLLPSHISLNFILFLLAHSCNLARSLCEMVLPSDMSISTTQVGATSKLGEAAFNPIIQTIYEDVE